MFLDWWKEKRARKRAKRAKAVEEWKNLYFGEIYFPTIIFNSDTYLCVSDVEEYCIDADIHIWFVNANSELVDAKGNMFNFKKIAKHEWVPDKKTGKADFQKVKERVTPLLYMPAHKKGLARTKSINELIDLIIED